MLASLRIHSRVKAKSVPLVAARCLKTQNSVPTRWSMQGKNVLVTGGSKGIGRAVVAELSSMGATVLTCSRSAAELQAAFPAAAGIHTVVADVSTDVGRQALISRARELFGSELACLVNNVGTNTRKRATEYSPAEYSHIFNTNLTSAFALCQLCHPLLKASKNGSIVNLSSVAGNTSISMSMSMSMSMSIAFGLEIKSYCSVCRWL
jgi:Tropinone reductase 1